MIRTRCLNSPRGVGGLVGILLLFHLDDTFFLITNFHDNSEQFKDMNLSWVGLFDLVAIFFLFVKKELWITEGGVGGVETPGPSYLSADKLFYRSGEYVGGSIVNVYQDVRLINNVHPPPVQCQSRVPV